MDTKRLRYFLRPRKIIRELEAQNQEMKQEVGELEGAVQELRLSIVDILSGTKIIGEEGVGNQYTQKKEAIRAISEKYRNEQDWGCQVVQRIVNQRKALVIPNGVQPQPAAHLADDDHAAEEVEYIRRFLDENEFDTAREDRLCRQAEMEGEVLVNLVWDSKANDGDGLVRVKRRLWSQMYWVVEMDPEDVDTMKWIKWTESGGMEKKLVPGTDNFVHAAFAGAEYSSEGSAGVNVVYRTGMPVAAYVLGECENYHKGLAGWRKVNSYYANLTPFFTSESPSETAEILGLIDKQGWKVGKAFAGRKFELVGPSEGAAVQQLIYTEIRTNAQSISGATGIPIHYLGFPDVIGAGRATAETMTEPMEVIALNDMAVWYQFYSELFDMAIDMRNEKANQELRVGVVRPRLMSLSDRDWLRLEKVWLPAAVSGIITKDLFAEKLDLSYEEAKKEAERRLKNSQQESLGKFGEQLGRLMASSSTEPDETEEE